ncbi:MAG: tetratricopeptide repeat protein [Gammaproteobacteria bacterium]|nr:tetratricopeptide repeat protein [Gammaproteobacteria bacterium]MBU1415840.1 tetratricopeptide repeat protein [Gammaproteobacteria bacterium]
MSLLMDALKRAELAKQQGQAEAASEAPTASASTSEADAPPTILPELPKLEDLDKEFISQTDQPAAQPRASATEHADRANAKSRHRTRPAGTPPSGTASERAAIKNAFAVKGAIAQDRQGLVIAAAVALLVVGGLIVWLWLNLKPVEGIAAPPRVPEPQGIAVGRNPAPPPAVAAETQPAAPASSSVVWSATSSASQAESEERAAVARAIVPKRTQRRPAVNVPADDAAIRVTRARPGVDPSVAEGFRLLQTGNLRAARAAYADALRGDPRNADALHGIAAIALREGRTEEAADIYQRILEINPADAAAQAGMLGLNGQIDPVAGESRIKSLLAAQGELPVLNFALGNLYARQQRWNDAQQAYFKAVTAEAGNPDYLFNLAVSLDQLHQPRLAAQYYDQALTVARGRAAAFDTALAARRIRELQP